MFILGSLLRCQGCFKSLCCRCQWTWFFISSALSRLSSAFGGTFDSGCSNGVCQLLFSRNQDFGRFVKQQSAFVTLKCLVIFYREGCFHFLASQIFIKSIFSCFHESCFVYNLSRPYRQIWMAISEPHSPCQARGSLLKTPLLRETLQIDCPSVTNETSSPKGMPRWLM